MLRAKGSNGGDARKIVVSNQKLAFTWRDSEQLERELVEAVTALKKEPGGDTALSGSVSVVRQLLAAVLRDELHLLVHPVAVRKPECRRRRRAPRKGSLRLRAARRWLARLVRRRPLSPRGDP
jgi:dihydrofolate reductase